METNSTQQEILLITGSNFMSGQWSRKENVDADLTDKEQLKEACWNGLLKELLPEICGQGADAGLLYLWQIKETDSFLELELGEFPPAIEKYYSLNPHSYLSTRSDN
jgi:hypothetical protein